MKASSSGGAWIAVGIAAMHVVWATALIGIPLLIAVAALTDVWALGVLATVGVLGAKFVFDVWYSYRAYHLGVRHPRWADVFFEGTGIGIMRASIGWMLAFGAIGATMGDASDREFFTATAAVSLAAMLYVVIHTAAYARGSNA